MDEYVSRVLLEINGQNIDDFSSVTEGEKELAKIVKLMNKRGIVGVTTDLTVEVDYILPLDTPEFDFDSVKGGTLTIDKQNGVRVTYTGVNTLKIGATKYDGNAEGIVRTITFGATGLVK